MWGMVDGEEVEGIGFLVGIVETWYVKVSKTVTSAAILKLLIRPDSSADHPKIMSIQYKTHDHECSNMFS